MQRLAMIILGVSALAAGCGGTSTPPTAPAQGGTTTATFTVPLSSANEVPAITNAEAGSTGTATLTLTVTRDGSGTITAATMNVQIAVTGFPAGTSVTRAHLHNAGAGANGGIFVDTTLAPGDLVVTNGSGTATKNGINLAPDRAAALLLNPAGHYFNVHTALNPDGAIRGQLPAPA